ncbi:hypothetical protein LWI29_016486 [Acer saccharum]|uniref:Uncharacterized protein n=1 Tax=Acer saccharum TaxID=4024 RepID=A0AA39W3H2_ACESA|nr:hypothetical protein LWI29_016486 [Acer saccharum]
MRFQNEAGTGPSKLQKAGSNTFKFRRLPIVSGSFPEKLVKERLNNLRGLLQLDTGKVPVRPIFSDRISFWRNGRWRTSLGNSPSFFLTSICFILRTKDLSSLKGNNSSSTQAGNSSDTSKIWVSTNPRGAERLPPNIVASESDFY